MAKGNEPRDRGRSGERLVNALDALTVALIAAAAVLLVLTL